MEREVPQWEAWKNNIRQHGGKTNMLESDFSEDGISFEGWIKLHSG